MPEVLNKISWDTLKRNIKSRSCVLVIGPEIVLSKSEGNFMQEFESYVKMQISEEIVLSNDGFFNFEREEQEQDVYTCLGNFLNEQPPNEIFSKILAIPFHLIISLSPDKFLKTESERLHFGGFQFDYYKKGGKPQAIGTEKLKPPSEERPIVYNLLGSVEDVDSLVLTFDALFDYMKSVFGGYELDAEVVTSLRNVNHIILLGFQYEKWYFKVLFKLLQKKQRALRQAYCESRLVNDDVKRFYSKDLKIEFVENNPRSFIQELYKNFEDAGELRQPVSDKISWLEKFIESVDSNDIEVSCKELLTKTTDNDTIDRIRSFSSSFQSAKNDYNDGAGTSTKEEYNTAINKSKKGLRDIAREIANEE